MPILEMGRFDWVKSDFTIGDGGTHRNAHVWYDGVTLRAEDATGTDLGTFTPVEINQLDAKAYRFTFADDTYAVVYRRGCNCGGG